ncbi:MAG TPA: alkaline phosphatase family protein [Solirubrobacteraceae bacterium]|nr:alkaline phosphatase family protein [Solirubrobacteraceae bacterium]
MTAGERVLVVLLDAFGSRFLERHGGHPLVSRLEVTPLRSQFPSTTAAHVTTMHFGLPVAEHGIYEWLVLEASLRRIICPLRFCEAGGRHEGSLRGQLDPDTLVAAPTFYERLGARSLVAQPRAIANSTYSTLATRGASVMAFEALPGGLHGVARELAEDPELRYAFLYWDAIDRAGHVHGPESEQFDAEVLAALDALEGVAGELDGVSVLVTADHGQLAVSPDRVDYLDELWPGLVELLEYEQPAGSSRDAFLHVRDGALETVIAGLAERLGDRAQVLAARECFDGVGPALAARLADVVVLPAPGRQAWLRRATAQEAWFRGHHGGLDPAETGTYLAELAR